MDEFVKAHKVSLTIMKIDVDGSELLLLKGCREILSNSDKIKMAICTYHAAEDEETFRGIFWDYGIAVSPSKGYMIFYYDENLSAPYLRRGLLRASK